jgi:hypothetical protein
MAAFRINKPVEVREFGRGHLLMRETFTVPAGARVVACNDGSGEYFLDDLSSVPAFSKHDATYYGVRIAADYVEQY